VRPALLTREVCRNFSRVVMDLFLPCLVLASIGGTLNPGTLRDSWHLVVGSALSIVLSNATAWAFGRLLMSRNARSTFQPVQIAIAFPNCLVFPLVLMDALCEQDIINSDFAGDSNECNDQATGMIFVFVACWQIFFFGWGVSSLKENNALELSLTSQPTIVTATTAPNNLTEELAISAGPIHRPLRAAGLPRYEKDGRSKGSNSGKPGSSLTAAVAGAGPAILGTPGNADGTGVTEARAVEIVGEERQVGADDGVSPCTSSAGNGVLSTMRHQTETTAVAADGRSSGYSAAEDSRDVTTQRLTETERTEGVAESCEMEEGGGDGGGTGGDGFDGHDGGRVRCDGRGGTRTGGGPWERVKQRAWNVVASPVIIALVAGIVVCVIEPLQDMLFHNPQAFLRPLGGAVQQAAGVPTVTVATLIMAGSLVLVAQPPSGALSPMGGGEMTTPIWRRPGFIMGTLLVLLRLIAIPAALFGLFWLAKSQSSVMGDNRLMHLILLVEFAMPSASLLITVLNQERMPNTAGFLTRLLVWQFAASSITVSIWTALAINMLY
ncbi:unnamed protein product, partial [Hapterophycus canaliculatus]